MSAFVPPTAADHPLASPAEAQAAKLPLVSVLLVDDRPAFRQGLRTLLNFYNTVGSGNFEVIGEAASADQALHLAKAQNPSLILLDLEMPSSGGLQLLHDLRHQAHSSKVLVLSAHTEDEWIFQAMQAGANGYLRKRYLSSHLSSAIETVLAGKVYLTPDALTGFFRLFHFYSGQAVVAAQKLNLTQREQEVLHWLVQGDGNEAIAARLFITVATVKAHLTAIFQKLGVTSRTQAIIKALKLGLVQGGMYE